MFGLARRLGLVGVASTVWLLAIASVGHAGGGRDALGLRAGFSSGPDQFVLGAQAELGPVLGPAYFVPSLDLGVGDDITVATANIDLRWYLLPLPETGIQIYGSAGPTLLLSPDTDIGFSLTAGVDVPMKNRRRYNIELRFGFGDIPDVKFVAGLMFGM